MLHAAYIVAAARTAGGRRGGRLTGWHPADLAGQVLDALVHAVRARGRNGACRRCAEGGGLANVTASRRFR